MVSAATGGTPHSSAASSFSHRVMSLGGASATGCSVCTRGDRDGGGGGREGEGGGRVGLGWGGEEGGLFCHTVVLFLTLDQIQLDALSAAVWSCCVALRLALFVSPSLVRYEVVVRPMKPRQPTSMGTTWQARPLSSHSMRSFSYRSFSLSKASSMFSSHGTVSSTMMTRLTVSDRITMSGRS